MAVPGINSALQGVPFRISVLYSKRPIISGYLCSVIGRVRDIIEVEFLEDS